jgi:hypothetical protein
LAEVAAVLSPEIVVLSLGKTRLSKRDQGILRALGERVPVAIGGARQVLPSPPRSVSGISPATR